MLATISYQDITSRAVYWILFPILGLSLASLFFLKNSLPLVVFYSVLLNCLLVSALLLLLFLFTKLALKKKFLNHSFGMGDLLLFYALALGFPTLTFTLLFVVSILFALGVYLCIKKTLKDKTVPLAGLMSACMLFVILASLLFPLPSLYIL